jgi:hypothetical protein
MKRLIFGAGVAVAFVLGGAGAVHADSTDGTGTTSNSGCTTAPSKTNCLLNRIPGFAGPPVRHVCLISDQANKGICVFLPLP